MCELLGENEGANDCVQNNDKTFMGSEEMVYEKAYILTDFRMLYKDGNNILVAETSISFSITPIK